MKQTLAKEISKIVKAESKRFENDQSFQHLRKFYDEMKEKGVVRKQEYSLAPLDTIGFVGK